MRGGGLNFLDKGGICQHHQVPGCHCCEIESDSGKSDVLYISFLIYLHIFLFNGPGDLRAAQSKSSLIGSDLKISVIDN